MSEAKSYPAPVMVERKCEWCRKPFQARKVDVKRGWGRFCSKSCKAKKQEKRTGQYAELLIQTGGERPTPARDLPDWARREREHDDALYESTSSHGQDDTGGW
ncbi:hypothetical protein [Burkholderia cenocepacia]|uniref:hypothetical protein n=1 Tax=Burkholderia cenocepacia TaxID=95486 RepID=UPI000F5A70EE|nr:hypothetical protein [Burkholderia cenocepacia]